MFAKLLKYEWKSNVGLFSLLGGCALAIGCIAAIVLRLLTTYWDQIIDKDEFVIILIPAFLFLFFAYMALILYMASTQYILLFRFYKSRFTDEGYLMFTLPVKTSHIFLSSAVNILIWNVITGVVLIAALAIAIGLGPVWPDYVQSEIQMAFTGADSIFSELMTPGYAVTSIISMIVMFAYGIIAPMTAVVLGSAAAKKHKVLAIIGIMIAISMFTGTLNGIVSGIMQFLLIAAEDHFQLITTLTPVASSIFPLILTITGYILSIHIMKKRLNLP